MSIKFRNSCVFTYFGIQNFNLFPCPCGIFSSPDILLLTHRKSSEIFLTGICWIQTNENIIFSYSLEIMAFTYKKLYVIYTFYSKRSRKNCNKSICCIYKYLFNSHKCQWIHDNLIEKSLHFQQSKCDLNRTKYNLRRYILYTKLLHSIKWWRCYLLTGLIHFLAYGLLFLKKSHAVSFFLAIEKTILKIIF